MFKIIDIDQLFQGVFLLCFIMIKFILYRYKCLVDFGWLLVYLLYFISELVKFKFIKIYFYFGEK